jgi:hypothetical protein
MASRFRGLNHHGFICITFASCVPLDSSNRNTLVGNVLLLTPSSQMRDLGTTTGWAIHSNQGVITSGTISFKNDRWQGGGMRFLKFNRFLKPAIVFKTNGAAGDHTLIGMNSPSSCCTQIQAEHHW